MSQPDSDGFDPYYKWLGIPPGEQPPNHYRLLGIRLFEEDADVIAAAADRQMAHVKSFAFGSYSAESQILLNHLAKARVCLLNPAQKERYDARLRQGTSTREGNRVKEFDPYYQWLSIPPEEQPPNHYRLLGLKDFEPDPHVIRAAFQRQTVFVRGYLKSDLASHAENVLRELEVAQHGLLNPKAKAAYDGWLRSLESRKVDKTRQSSATEAPVLTALHSLPQEDPSSVSHRTSTRRRTRKSNWVWHVGMGIVLLGIVAYVAYRITSHADPDTSRLFASAGSRNRHQPSPVDKQSNRPQVPPAETAVDRPRRPAAVPPVVANGRLTAEASSPAALDSAPALKARAIKKEQTRQPNASADRLNGGAGSLEIVRTNVELPTLDTDTLVPLVALPDRIAGDVEFTLRSYRVNQVSVLQIQSSSGDPGEWIVVAHPEMDAGATAESDPMVARFAHVDDHLAFQWSPDAPLEITDALRNSIVELRTSDRQLIVGLREPIIVDPLTINLRQSVQRAPLKCEALPDEADLRISLLVSALPPHQVADVDITEMRIDEEAVLRYTNPNGVATRCRMTVRGNVPFFEIGTRYVLPSGDEEPLSIARGNRKMRMLTSSINEAEGAIKSLPQLKKYLAGLQAQLRRPQNAVSRLNAQLAYDSTNRKIAAAEAMVGALPTLQQDFVAIQHIAQFAQQIDKKAQVGYRLYHSVDGCDVDLIVASVNEIDEPPLTPPNSRAMSRSPEANRIAGKTNDVAQSEGNTADVQPGSIENAESTGSFSVVEISSTGSVSQGSHELHGWRLTVRNDRDRPIRLQAKIQWQDAQNQVIAEQHVSSLVVDPNNERTETGRTSIPSEKTADVQSVQAVVTEQR